MRKEIIDNLVAEKQLRVRQLDVERILSIINSAVTNAKVSKGIRLNDDSATVVFRELYESVRQLGDACWWIEGYEPLNHEISLEILKELDIKNKIKLNHLYRFKKIRNDANYRGFRVSVSQAKEVIEFWDTCGKEILGIISKRIRQR
ncbi:MAG: hypothetical protein HYY37_05190 [Candidatus Aenigmarchaeota archaeon]|nr:hypothetical protein [Candidatus Aenigmarchaeota archaeon]